jgi:mannose-6-phosphate isomerase-like protein (cupin superfamily)
MTSDTHAAGPVDQGKWLQTRPGERCLIRVAAAETNGAYSVVEILAHPGESTPMHVHQNEDEHFLILEGTARIVCGKETFDAPAGTAVTLPRLIPHAWGNASCSTLRMVVTCWPGGCDAILPLIARGGDIDLKSLGAKFGVRRVGPPLLEDRRSGLVRRLVLAKTDPAKQRIRAWLSDIDDERLFCLGLTSEDMAALRGTARPRRPSPKGSMHRQKTAAPHEQWSAEPVPISIVY